LQGEDAREAKRQQRQQKKSLETGQGQQALKAAEAPKRSQICASAFGAKSTGRPQLAATS
jgi:hypothetical protein